MGARRLLVGELLDVGGNDDRGHGALRERDPHGPVDDVGGLARVVDLGQVLATRRP